MKKIQWLCYNYSSEWCQQNGREGTSSSLSLPHYRKKQETVRTNYSRTMENGWCFQQQSECYYQERGDFQAVGKHGGIFACLSASTHLRNGCSLQEESLYSQCGTWFWPLVPEGIEKSRPFFPPNCCVCLFWHVWRMTERLTQVLISVSSNSKLSLGRW